MEHLNNKNNEELIKDLEKLGQALNRSNDSFKFALEQKLNAKATKISEKKFSFKVNYLFSPKMAWATVPATLLLFVMLAEAAEYAGVEIKPYQYIKTTTVPAVTKQVKIVTQTIVTEIKTITPKITEQVKLATAPIINEVKKITIQAEEKKLAKKNTKLAKESIATSYIIDLSQNNLAEKDKLTIIELDEKYKKMTGNEIGKSTTITEQPTPLQPTTDEKFNKLVQKTSSYIPPSSMPLTTEYQPKSTNYNESEVTSNQTEYTNENTKEIPSSLQPTYSAQQLADYYRYSKPQEKKLAQLDSSYNTTKTYTQPYSAPSSSSFKPQEDLFSVLPTEAKEGKPSSNDPSDSTSNYYYDEYQKPIIISKKPETTPQININEPKTIIKEDPKPITSKLNSTPIKTTTEKAYDLPVINQPQTAPPSSIYVPKTTDYKPVETEKMSAPKPNCQERVYLTIKVYDLDNSIQDVKDLLYNLNFNLDKINKYSKSAYIYITIPAERYNELTQKIKKITSNASDFTEKVYTLKPDCSEKYVRIYLNKKSTLFKWLTPSSNTTDTTKTEVIPSTYTPSSQINDTTKYQPDNTVIPPSSSSYSY